MKYDLIILIIASSDLDIYAEMKKISQQYLKLFENRVKYYYLEYADQENDLYEFDNTLYFKGKESIVPSIYNKTIKGLEYINMFEYDVVMRTNLSSFLNIDNILNFISLLPKTNSGGGHLCFNDFISGTGIFMSKDVANVLVNKVDSTQIHDDVLISRILRNNSIIIFNINTYNYDVEHLCDAYNENVKIASNVLYYRIKNDNDRSIDIKYFKLLLSNIYNIQ